MDWVKQIAFPHGDGPRPIVEGLNLNKRASPLLSKRESFCLVACELGCQLFPTFGLKLKHQLFLGVTFAGLQTGSTLLAVLVLRPSVLDWNQTISSPGSPACRLILEILGLVRLTSLCSHISHFLILSLFLSFYLYFCICFSRETEPVGE